MKYLTIFLFLFGSLQAHFDLQPPPGFEKETDAHESDGSFEVWRLGDDSVWNLTSYFTEEKHTMDEILHFMKEGNEELVEIDRISENDAYIRWTIPCQPLLFAHIRVTEQAFHSVGYMYTGPCPESVDLQGWGDFVRAIPFI
jgi:hypothetical protein